MATHYLSRLFTPASVAIIGATERQGALGRFVFENMRSAGFRGALYAVNPKHAQVFDSRCYPTVARLPARPDLIVVATPAASVASVLKDAGEAGVRHAVVLSAGFAEIGPEGKRRALEVASIAQRYGIRIIGPNCIGIMRPSIGLNATFANAGGKAGSLALVSQSGAVCTAILDWAASTEIGFSSVISLGGALDLDFGEVLDFLVNDAETHSILLYIEGIREARSFVSALRAAARVKPVVVLKAGRFAVGSKAVASHTGALTGSDSVFDAALARSGAVRVKSSLQLFAAARLLAQPQLARALGGEQLAIITNGGGPGVVAADCAADAGLSLANLAESTLAALSEKLPAHWSHGNPVDLIGDATPQRFSDAIRFIAADPGVNALLVLFCPQTVTSGEAAAAAVIDAARQSMAEHSKPVFTAWLGGASIIKARALFEAAGIPNFLTPETAVEAFSYLARFRRHQSLLLESVPAAESMARQVCDAAIARAQEIRALVLADRRTLLSGDESKQLLHAFGLPVALGRLATTREAAQAAAKAIGFPVVMKIDSPQISHKSDVGGVRLNLMNARQVGSAFEEMLEQIAGLRPDAKIGGVSIQAMLKFDDAREVLVGVSRDPIFGPVIAFGSGGVAVEAARDTALALPPLNQALAEELVLATRVHRILAAYRNVPGIDRVALIRILLRVSTIASVLPWVREMDLNPVLAHPAGAAIVDARIVIDADSPATDPRYRHMAIFPYPIELERDLDLRDGSRLHLRAIRPDDSERERAFVAAMSDQSRYSRFLHPIAELSPEMIARFTQLDYDREMALVALTMDQATFIGIARYFPNPDRSSVEFALAIADAWQRKGLGVMLMKMLIECARAAGYRQISGTVLPGNLGMLKLASTLGFAIEADKENSNTTRVAMALA